MINSGIFKGRFINHFCGCIYISYETRIAESSVFYYFFVSGPIAPENHYFWAEKKFIK